MVQLPSYRAETLKGLTGQPMNSRGDHKVPLRGATAWLQGGDSPELWQAGPCILKVTEVACLPDYRAEAP